MGFDEMEAPAPQWRVHRYEHEGKQKLSIWFFCPSCEKLHGLDEGWGFNGDWHNATFTPSYLTWNDPNPAAKPGRFRDGWRCHSYIKNGHIEFLSDCTHAHANETMLIPEFRTDD